MQPPGVFWSVKVAKVGAILSRMAGLSISLTDSADHFEKGSPLQLIVRQRANFGFASRGCRLRRDRIRGCPSAPWQAIVFSQSISGLISGFHDLRSGAVRYKANTFKVRSKRANGWTMICMWPKCPIFGHFSVLVIPSCYRRLMEIPRDAIYFDQLARVARVKAAECGDPVLAIRLREQAIKHERTARKLRREESPS